MIALVDQVLAGRDARLLRPDSMRGL